MANNNRGTKDSSSLEDGEEQRQERLWIFGFASITNTINIMLTSSFVLIFFTLQFSKLLIKFIQYLHSAWQITPE